MPPNATPQRPSQALLPSAELRALLGLAEGARVHRCDAVQGIYAYIGEHGIPLANGPADAPPAVDKGADGAAAIGNAPEATAAAARAYVLDDALAAVFHAPLTPLNLASQLAPHLSAPPAEDSAAAAPKPKSGARKRKSAPDAGGDGEEGETPKKKKGRGFAAPQTLSDDLAAVVGQPVASRGEVMKLLWQRIKERELQARGC